MIIVRYRYSNFISGTGVQFFLNGAMFVSVMKSINYAFPWVINGLPQFRSRHLSFTSLIVDLEQDNEIDTPYRTRVQYAIHVYCEIWYDRSGCNTRLNESKYSLGAHSL